MTDYPFFPLRLGPRDVAYLWVGTVGNGAANVQTVALYKLDGTRAEPITRAARAPLICNKLPMGPAVHLFPAVDCSQTYPRGSSSASMQSMTHLASYFKSASHDNYVHTSGLWVSCSEGCCQVSMLQ
jgi:hypothetical protein